MKGKVTLEGSPEPYVNIYESNINSVPVKRNNRYYMVETDTNGEFEINLPETSYITVRRTGYNQQTHLIKNLPKIIDLKTSGNLPEIEVTPKKNNYYWLLLLLLIPIFLKRK